MDTPTTTPTITTSDLNHSAWLVAHDLAFLGADLMADGRVAFTFDDPDSRGDALVGAFVRDPVLARFAYSRGRLAFLLRTMHERGAQRLDVSDLPKRWHRL